MCMFYHKWNYAEEGAWPTASEKEGRCVVVEWDPCPSACSSVVPLGLSGQNPLSSLWPFCTDENTFNTAGRGEGYGECKHWWYHVKLESLGVWQGHSSYRGPFIACMKNTFLTKCGNPASWRLYTPLERQRCFLRDVTGFWEGARVLSFDFGARSFPPMTRKGIQERKHKEWCCHRNEPLNNYWFLNWNL